MANILKDKEAKSRAFFFFNYFRDLAYGMLIDITTNPKSYLSVRSSAFDRLNNAYKAFQNGKSKDIVSRIARGQNPISLKL